MAITEALESPNRSPLRWLGYATFFGMMVLPTTYQIERGVLLGLVCLMAVYRALFSGRLAIDHRVLHLTIFYVAVGFGYWIWGTARGNPGATPSLTVFVLWPLVYLLLISLINKSHVQGLIKTMVLGSLAIEGYGLMYLFHSKGWLPSSLYINLNAGQRAGFYGVNDVGLTLYSFTTLIFLLPFNLTVLLTVPKAHRNSPVLTDGVLALTLLLGLILTLLSGRRGLVVSIGLTPLLLLLLRTLIPALPWKGIGHFVGRFALFSGIGLVALLFVGSSFQLSFSGLSSNFLAGFNFNGGALNTPTFTAIEGQSGAVIRGKEAAALWSGANEYPFFGAGLGAVAPGYTRDPFHPWAYELSYLDYLFEFGFVGIFAFLSGGAWIVWRCGQIARARDPVLSLWMLPLLVGLISFVIATTANPYIGKFDFLWVIFLPVAFINSDFLDRSEVFPSDSAPSFKIRASTQGHDHGSSLQS